MERQKQFQFEALDGARFGPLFHDQANLPSGYARVGARLKPILDAAGLELARARGRGQDPLAGALYLGGSPCRRLRAMDASPTAQVIYDSLSARLAPRQGLAALAAAAGQGRADCQRCPSDGEHGRPQAQQA